MFIKLALNLTSQVEKKKQNSIFFILATLFKIIQNENKTIFTVNHCIYDVNNICTGRQTSLARRS
jgi:hypothetical protein